MGWRGECLINKLLGLLILDLPLPGWMISGKVPYPFSALLATSVSGGTNAQRPVVNLSPKPQPGEQAWCGAPGWTLSTQQHAWPLLGCQLLPPPYGWNARLFGLT